MRGAIVNRFLDGSRSEVSVGLLFSMRCRQAGKWLSAALINVDTTAKVHGGSILPLRPGLSGDQHADDPGIMRLMQGSVHRSGQDVTPSVPTATSQ